MLRSLLRSALAALLIFSSILISLAPVIWREGWPENHEALNWTFLVREYHRHFAVGDFMPIWSANDVYGMGSPLPLFYHKLFYFLAGWIFHLCSDMKGAIVSSLGFWMLVGELGFFFFFQRVGASVLLAAALSAVFPLLSYSSFDWFVRGAMAEFTAAAMIPWLLWSWAKLRQERRLPMMLPVIVALTALSHTVIGYVAALFSLVLLAQVSYEQTHKMHWLGQNLWRLLAGSLVPCFLIGLYSLVYRRVFRFFDPGMVKVSLAPVTQNFLPFVQHYLLGSREEWVSHWGHVHVEYDGPLLLCLWILAPTLLWVKIFWLKKLCQALLLMLLGIVFMQFPIAAFVYHIVPGLEYLQFPWRLRCFDQTIMLGLVGVQLATLQQQRFGKLSGVIAFLLLSMMVICNKTNYPFRYDWFSAEKMVTYPTEPITENGMIGAGEYLPLIVPYLSYRDRVDLHPGIIEGFKNLSIRGVEEFVPEGKPRACHTLQLRPRSTEHLSMTVDVSCAAPAVLVLPHAYSSLERLYWHKRDGQIMRLSGSTRTAEDPRIRITVPAGDGVLYLLFPRLDFVTQKL